MILFMYENKLVYTMSLEDKLREDKLREDMHMSSAAASLAAARYAAIIMRIAKNTPTKENENAAIVAAWYSESANRDKTFIYSSNKDTFIFSRTTLTNFKSCSRTSYKAIN